MPSERRPSLRRIGKRAFNRSLLGYRRREVDDAIATRDMALELLGKTLETAEASLKARRATIQAQNLELARRGDEIDELERVATRLAERVVAREGELRWIGAELERARERLLATPLEELAAELDPPPELPPIPVGSNGHRAHAHGELFEGPVEVEIGPLSDFSQLVGFEDAAGGISATSEISVTRFAKGRATLAMRLKEPVALLRLLEERAPFEFRVRDLRSDRLVLDVDE